MKYSASKGKTPMDWDKFLKDRQSGKDISAKDLSAAKAKSLDWVTCACGNQCDIIPRNSNGEPKNEELSDLGGDFYAYINGGHWEDARVTLNEIEKKSARIIASIRAAETRKKIKEAKTFLESKGYKVCATR